MNLLFKESFLTIQGEGPYAGRVAYFIRLAGCPLNCTWCDTDYDSDERIATEDLACLALDALAEYRDQLVVITGGEPMAQPIGELCEILLAWGMEVQVETSGALWTELPKYRRMSLVVSPKTTVRAECVMLASAWKYVVGTDDEVTREGVLLSDTQGTGSRKPLRFPSECDTTPVYVQPRDDGDDEKNAANTQRCVELCLEHGYRLSLQQHKIIGVE